PPDLAPPSAVDQPLGVSFLGRPPRLLSHPYEWIQSRDSALQPRRQDGRGDVLDSIVLPRSEDGARYMRLNPMPSVVRTTARTEPSRRDLERRFRKAVARAYQCACLMLPRAAPFSSSGQLRATVLRDDPSANISGAVHDPDASGFDPREKLHRCPTN